MMNAAWAQAPLGNFKATTLAQQDVFSGNSHIVKAQFCVPQGRVIVTERGQWSNNSQAGSVFGYQYLRLL